jgi:sugar phosphate isomerase/epimerase
MNGDAQRSPAAESLILANGSLGPVSFPERVAAAASGGFDGIGLSVWEYARLEDDGYDAAAMRETLNRHGIRLVELEVFLGFAVSGEVAETEPIPGLRYTDKVTEARLFEMADIFGARHLQAVGTFGSDVLEADAAEAFARLCDRAAEHGLLVALEFVPGTNVPDAAVARRIVDDANRRNGGICVDAWHHFRGRADDDLLIALRPEQVVMIQLDDGPRVPRDPDFLIDTMRYRQPPGAGEFDLAHFLHLLWQSGVDAPISVEVLSSELSAHPAEDVAKLLGDGTRDVIAAARHPR